jgi:protein gp37
VFVNSMSDLFHADVPTSHIVQVFAVMALAPQHTFQVLTKRHARMRSLLDSWDFWRSVSFAATDRAGADIDLGPSLPNVWLGVSVENQQWADIRIPALLGTPAAVRFLSCEPLLGPVDLLHHMPEVPYWDAREAEEWGIHWVIVGGESGRGARPMHPDWARSLRDQCSAARVPFLFKQWGAWAPTGARGAGITRENRMYVPDSVARTECPPAHQCGAEIRRMPKHLAGRELDGRTWDQYPEVGTNE